MGCHVVCCSRRGGCFPHTVFWVGLSEAGISAAEKTNQLPLADTIVLSLAGLAHQDGQQCPEEEEMTTGRSLWNSSMSDAFSG